MGMKATMSAMVCCLDVWVLSRRGAGMARGNRGGGMRGGEKAERRGCGEAGMRGGGEVTPIPSHIQKG